MTTLLGMFAKYWQPGQVKTRLAASIGQERAAAVQRLFVETLVRRFRAAADHCCLVYSPAERREEFRLAAGPNWKVEPQGEGDLGKRMERFFAASLPRAERVVLIGSDSPDLPLECLQQAFEALATHDVVLGPATDGGYYLVGAARRVPPIFEGIDWSTPDVWTQTVARLTAASIAWQTLPPWCDVDDQRGLQSLAFRIGKHARNDRDMESLLGGLFMLTG